MSQKEASEALSEGDLSVSERALSDYERGKGLPPRPKRAAILRRLRSFAGEDVGSVVERTDHRRPGHVPRLGFLEADEDAAPAPGPPSLPARGVEVAVARIVTESHDEAGLQWAVEVRFWARPEARSLGMVTRIETVSEPERESPAPEGDLD